MAVTARAAPSARLDYLDGLRGAALVLMVVNHTDRWWMDGRMTWSRYHLTYVTLTLAAPTFLFLVGFCLPLALRNWDGGLAALARRFVPRGARIVLAGLLLNVVVFREDSIVSILSGGVLQTIGLAIIAMVPAAWLLRWPAARWALVLVAAAGYVAFVLAVPALARVVQRHEVLGRVLFYDFPPWPWVGLVLLGLVLGQVWLDAYRRDPEAGARFMGWAAVAGAILVAAFFVHDWWAPPPMRFGMRRDIILNHHWTPAPAALPWVLGMVLLLLAGAYWLVERRRWRLPPLLILGRTALFLYFFHQVLAYNVVGQWLGWRFNAWPGFWLANAVFVLLLIACGWAWLETRRRVGRLRRPRLAPAGRAGP